MTPPIERFADERWTAGIIGLGYVGLPLAMTASARGLGVIGFDVSSERIAALMAGQSHVGDVSDEELKEALAAGAVFTDDPDALREADAIFICVPSPLGRNRQPDLSYIEAAARTVSSIARPGQLVSLESTTYPGTTEDIIVPAVQSAGLKLDEDVFVAFSPERVSPGDPMKTAEIPKVVGGVTEMSGLVAEVAYRRLVPSVYRVSSARAAEMAKLLENTTGLSTSASSTDGPARPRAGHRHLEVIDAASTRRSASRPSIPVRAWVDTAFLSTRSTWRGGHGSELRHPLHRHRRAGQHPHAGLRRPHRAILNQAVPVSGPASSPSGSPTRPTWPTTGSPPPSR